MSSIKDMLIGLVTLVLGDGNIKSDSQGFVIILIDKCLQVITDVLKS